jgi:hypothetical protein
MERFLRMQEGSQFFVYFLTLLRGLAAILWFGAGLLPADAKAYEPKLDHLIVTNNQEHIILFSQLKDAFTDEFLEAFSKGLPFEFVYEISLYRERQFWPDKHLHSTTLIHKGKFDMLKEEFDFIAVYNGKEVKKTTSNKIEIQRWMSNLNGVEIFPLNLVTGLKRRYFLEVRALISSPRNLSSENILFFFQESGPHQTDWRRSPLFSAGGQR